MTNGKQLWDWARWIVTVAFLAGLTWASTKFVTVETFDRRMSKLEDQAKTYVLRGEYETRHEELSRFYTAIRDDIKSLTTEVKVEIERNREHLVLQKAVSDLDLRMRTLEVECAKSNKP